ncbi:N-acetylneuraminate synthase [Paenibacillus sp. PK3_47]|uniref:N-acetylneuraminate synthase n=1 Tax=Paenibacillus sp. PK3_47 TaxID=2072642 RepID=UPI00201D69C6|nr:N-acetylneuraminate synthase [Paenibacillus sp. PK3_47]UQZ33837.1 N-acetylneuraminate synthase [Paenibacillus sp. PK3_47]
MNATFVIAEAGVNHNGDLELAKRLVDIAVSSKADAVKFQTFKTELVISKHAPKAEYQMQTTGEEESQFEMVKKLELSFDQFRELKNYCEDSGIEFLSTPFDIESADFLIDELKLRTIKISSGEITNAPLLYHIACKKPDIILSTGMATLSEVEAALGVIAFGLLSAHDQPSVSAFRAAYLSPEGQEQLQRKVKLLHCTTEYPAPVKDVNLLAIETMQKAFGLPVGYSDHTEGIAVTVAAVALGARIIEKHITHNKQAEGPDHKASLSPDELKLLIESIRQVELAKGTGIKIPAKSELKNLEIARKSIVASKKIKVGEKLTLNNITIKRPGNGISPFEYWEMLTEEASKDFNQDEPLSRL